MRKKPDLSFPDLSQCLVPREKAVTICALSMEEVRERPYQEYGIEIPPHIHRSVSKRQYEFVGGRLCAQAACLKVQGEAPSIRQDREGRPIWPLGIIGSISHSSRLAIAAAAKKGKVRSIGIDTEIITNQKEVLLTIHRQVCLPDEERCFQHVENTFLFFSLKESLFKCLHPLYNCLLDFKDIQVVKVDKQEGRAYLIVSPTKGLPEKGYWGNFVVDSPSGTVYTLFML